MSSGTWTQKSSGSFTITNGVAFGIEAEARSGAAHGYAATVPAGQVGLWCSHASCRRNSRGQNAHATLRVRDLVGPYEADGRWFSDKAEVQIDESNSNLLRSSSATSSEYYDTCIVRRGFRAGKYVATFRFKWAPGPSPGFLVRWVNPGDWLAVIVKAADSKAWVYKRVNDGILQSRVPCRRPLRRRVDYVVHGCAKGRGFQVMPARWRLGLGWGCLRALGWGAFSRAMLAA